MRRLIKYAWANALLGEELLVTTTGAQVRIISIGGEECDGVDAPDFMDVKLEIDGKLWVGSVCCDVRSSDWFRRNNHCKGVFDSVLLYLVEEADHQVYRKSGELIPTLVPPNWLLLRSQIFRFLFGTSDMPCAKGIANISKVDMAGWIESLAFERLRDKIARIKGWYDSTCGSWEDVCYATFARNLGFGIDSDMMEELAMRTPLALLQRVSDSQTQVEALLFGQAGVLNSQWFKGDDYYQQLCREYAFLANKFSLSAMDSSSKLDFRGNVKTFPFRRIAVLAHFVKGGFRLMRSIIDTDDEQELRKLFNVEFTGYWATHSSFDKPASSVARVISRKSVDIVIINSVVPINYYYGEYIGDFSYCEKGVRLLESLAAEDNSIVRIFKSKGVKVPDALTSQALIQLYRNYCQTHRCEHCRIMSCILSVK
ncbi:MAG: DUF2851 family protein [Bacteroidales bacterium]